MLVCTKAKRNMLVRSSQSLQIKIRETELEVMNNTKYLGVQIGKSLDWKDQVRAVSSKASTGLGLLKHAKYFLPFSALTSFYSSIVESHFRYNCSVWDFQVQLKSIVCKNYKKGNAGIVTNNSFDTPRNQLIEMLGWKTINEFRRLRH